MISCANWIPPTVENTMSSGIDFRLAILASGKGSNADVICSYFQSHPSIHVVLILTNRVHAGVRQVASQYGIPSLHISKDTWSDAPTIENILTQYEVTHIILAGFLLLIPDYLTRKYEGRILNIHPALLPHYGGPGMYGHFVHEAVKAADETVSGITIHEVNEAYDAGKIIFQKEVDLLPDDTPDQIAQKVLRLEHHYYPRVISQWILGSPDLQRVK